MASESVAPQVPGLSGLFVDPASHGHPRAIARAAQRESSTLMLEMDALAELIFLAETNQESQLNSDTMAYVAMLFRRLSRMKIAFDELETKALGGAHTM